MRRKKLLPMSALSIIRSQNPSKKIVHCHGVFDVLHAGHLAYFESAKKYGDVLVVTLTADEFVNKGPGRPHFQSSIRAEMLAALEVVDYVSVNTYPTAVPAIETLKPDFYVKGPDYKNKADDVTGAIHNEETAVNQGGGQLVFTEDEVHSSSNLLNKFFNKWTDEQQSYIASVKQAGGYAAIEAVLERASKEAVSIVGEPIVDTYVFCTAENISSKSPSISARLLSEENYAGGALAIANHLADFVKETYLFTTHGAEPYFLNLLNEKLDHRVTFVGQELKDIPTPRKTRYISADKVQRMFELTDVRSDQWSTHSPRYIADKIQSVNSKERINILADFGHGLFEGEMLDCAKQMSGFVGLNVQTNSSNFGFNPFTKHKAFSYLSIDTKEARVAYHDRFTKPSLLAARLHQDLSARGAACSMTLGASGAYFFPLKLDNAIHSPAFTDAVVDATGAGDAYFALTSVLVKISCPDILIPFLGNVFAGLKTKIIGNKTSVTRGQLLKAVGAILK